MKTVVVVGGGITGLCTMHYLKNKMHEQNVEARLILIEKNAYLGGKIHSEYDKAFIMETGADSIVARHPGVLELVKELNFESELVYNETGISYIHTNNELHAIPAGSTFGIPMSVESLMSSTLISEEGKKRALQDLEIPNTKFTKESSIGTFLEYFLGEEIVRKQIAPVLAGVYSGDLYQLSLASTLPYLVDYKNNYGSIIKGFEAHREQFEKAANKKFISFRPGLSALINRLEEQLPEVEFMRKTVTKQILKKGEQYEVVLEDETILADIVVLAVPNETVRHVIQDDSLEEQLKKFTTASTLTMYVGFDVPDDILPADGTGFIVSHNSDLICNASTWTSRKWKHTSAEGNLLVRLFYKDINPRYEELAAMSDEELTKVALEDIRLSLGVEADPTVINVTKWIDQMPRYDLAHNEALSKVIQQLATDYPNVLLAGCAYFGVGIGACIQNGKKTAEHIISRIM
ncbi:Protoporphyrinogen oxidase [Solibacillus isronensis B3W22]|uniref:Coproporphyrinogen III oxidase n=1 Tax=Solibacillus isronensis B3W22 TaxID=1224748 RepID=K1KM92_9BACL|nr:protoporphyrinogen oxidase [Solibacillus isronensis]AMO87101.1 protoporphyrinogen oxidase [Solibacillus silvestris]EKB43631.1 Protoporphyrinogen oxidase [Solibacillus isronensis B3W22]